MESKKNNLFRRNTAFTIAEMIIVIGIVGIVAEMTLPNLINNFQEQVLKTSFKKAYAEASQAWAQVVAENPGVYVARGGATCTWPDGITADYDNADGRSDAFKEKMRVIKSCFNTTGCWPDDFEWAESLLGSYRTGQYSPYSYSWVSADGMCWSSPWKGRDEAHIIVDTNCGKKPNKIGQDIFSMLLGKDGVVYFHIGDKSTTGKPVSSGGVCPLYDDPATINGRSVSFRSWLSD